MADTAKNRGSDWAQAWVLGLVLAVFNTVKPPIIDDGIYLDFARQIVKHPLDPYGFESAWYHWNVPAIGVLCPPVVPYWLAMGMAVLGSGWVGLKLWMTPWCLLWAVSMFGLLRRWGKQNAVPALWVLGVSPLILPGVNMMLDIPMFGLVLASVWAFVVACEKRSVGLATVAGLLVGAAMETKFNAAMGFAAIGIYAAMFGRIRLGLVAIFTGCCVFGLAEGLMFEKYGASHFFYMLGMKDIIAGTGITDASELWANLWILGSVCPVFVVVVAWAMGAGRWWLTSVSAVAVGSVAMMAFESGIDPKWIAGTWGVLAIGALVVLMVMAVRRAVEKQAWFAWGRVTVSVELFLVMWLAVEGGLTMGISPFAAARRFIGVWTVGVILATRLAGRNEKDKREAGGDAESELVRRGERYVALKWIVPWSAALGLMFWATDLKYGWAVEEAYWQAKVAAEHDSEGRGGHPTIWSTGQWSGLYFSKEFGMSPMAPDETVVRAGEYVVIPTMGLFGPPVTADQNKSVLVKTIEVSDTWMLRTIPEFYGGGGVPVMRQHGPRVVLMLIRSDAEQICPTQFGNGLVAWWAITRKRVLPAGSVRAVLEAWVACDPGTRRKLEDALRGNGGEVLVSGMKLSDPRLRMVTLQVIADLLEQARSRNDFWMMKVLDEAMKNDPDENVRRAATIVRRKFSSVD